MFLLYSHFLALWQVDVSLLDVLEVSDHLGERLSVDDETLDAFGIICDNVCCANLLSAEGLLSEEVALVQVSDELLLISTFLSCAFYLKWRRKMNAFIYHHNVQK